MRLREGETIIFFASPRHSDPLNRNWRFLVKVCKDSLNSAKYLTQSLCIKCINIKTALCDKSVNFQKKKTSLQPQRDVLEIIHLVANLKIQLPLMILI